MHFYFQVGTFRLPGYSLMIIIGLLTGNFLVWLFGKRWKLSFNDFIILEAYTFLGAMIGAKGLYLFVARDQIQWNRFFEPEYFQMIMKGGFVFYGGLILGFAAFLLAGKIHKIDAFAYIRRLLFVVPYIHGFGRLGCFMAGCCYGCPYDGLGAVVFPEGSMAPAGIPLFPVQLVEAMLLFVLAGLLLLLAGRFTSAMQPVALYFGAYAVIRFALEYFRYDDAERGGFAWFSTSQWISIGVAAALFFVFGLRLFLKKRKKSVVRERLQKENQKTEHL